MSEDFYYQEWPMSDDSFIRDGDIRLVTIEVRVLFEETDKIVADVDENDDPVEFKDGFLMHIIDKTHVYRGEETIFMGQSCFKDPDDEKQNNRNFGRKTMKDFIVTNIIKVVLFWITMIFGPALMLLGFIFGAIYKLFTLKPKDLIAAYAETRFKIAFVNDILLNVTCKDLLNCTMVKTDVPHHSHGEIETMSRAIGKNKLMHSQKGFGVKIAQFLNWLDPNHVEDAANSDK